MGPFSQIQGASSIAHGVTQTVAVPSPSSAAQIYKYLPPALLETVAALFLVLDQVAAVHTIRRASFPPGLKRPH